MKQSISPESFIKLSQILNQQMGLHFPPERKNDLERELNNAYKSFGLRDLQELVNLILLDRLKKKDIDILAKHLTIGETYFFRENKTFESIEEYVIPAIIEGKTAHSRNLKIWCAGCSTGEEAYTLAIIIDRMKKQLEGWRVEILASDINTLFLQKASQGIYSEWSFRTIPAKVREKYFSLLDNGSFKINNKIRKKVSFSCLNLVEETDPFYTTNLESMDIIFCRNVMIYFNEANRNKIINSFYNLLTDKGWLAVGSTEVSQNYYSKFRCVNYPNAILYTKDRSSEINKVINDSINSTGITPAVKMIKHETTEITLNSISTPPELSYERQQSRHPEKEILRIAEEHFSRNQFSDVINYLETSFSDDGKYFLEEELQRGYKMIAKSYASLGEKENAKLWCEKAISIDRTNFSNYYLLANIFLEAENKEEAAASLRKSLFLSPDFVLGMFSLGSVLMRMGNRIEAVKQYENALYVLSKLKNNEFIPESDGLTVQQMQEIIKSLIKRANTE